MGTGVRMVVFDVGGVLVRVLAWDEGHTAAGLDPARLPEREPFLQAVSALNRAYDGGLLTTPEFEREVVRAAAGRHGLEEVRRIHAALIGAEFPGLSAVFEALEGKGVATGVLSNTNPSHWQRLANLGGGPAEYPAVVRAQHRQASFALRCSKPDMEIYRAFEELSGFGRDEILFFDDLERNVAGARAAGWQGERVDPLGNPAAQVMDVLNGRGLA